MMLASLIVVSLLLTTSKTFVRSPSTICQLAVLWMKLYVWFRHSNLLTNLEKVRISTGELLPCYVYDFICRTVLLNKYLWSIVCVYSQFVPRAGNQAKRPSNPVLNKAKNFSRSSERTTNQFKWERKKWGISEWNNLLPFLDFVLFTFVPSFFVI